MSFIIFPGVITPPLTPGAVPYGTGSNVLMNAQGTAGQVLLSNGASAPTWSNAVPSTTALAGGVAGDLPYQSAPSTTTFRNLVPGAVVYGDATAPNYTAVGTTGQPLLSNGTAAPAFGTLPVSGGGTGLATLTAENVILGDGTNNVKFVAPGSNGNVLQSNGTTWTSAPLAVSQDFVKVATFTTAAGTPTLLCANCFSVTYTSYMITFADIRCVSNFTLYLDGIQSSPINGSRFTGSDAGSTFRGAGQYVFLVPGTKLASSTYPVAGTVFFTNISSATRGTGTWLSGYYDVPNDMANISGAIINISGPNTGFTLTSSQNFVAGGVVTVYGLK